MGDKSGKKMCIYRKISIFLISSVVIFLGYNAYQYSNVTKNVQYKLTKTANVQEAYFAGGCFWCTESIFEKYKKYGIIDVVSGYAGGTIKNPTYRLVGQGDTGYREAVKVLYDADVVSYNDLLEVFWRTINPTDNDGQYVDRGFQYTSAIFYKNDTERKLSEKSLDTLQKSGRYGDKKLLTPIIAFTNFYDAEEYHQDYYIKNPIRYNVYTNGSGRKEYLEGIWGDELNYEFENSNVTTKITINYKGEPLTKIQYNVTQEKGTERSYDNKYWDNKREGIYVDIIDGTPLFSSTDKYKSGTGWPSFTKPIKPENVGEREDKGLFSIRTEIIGAKSKAHIGHVFTDGPVEKGGLRYCMNSAALDFIPKEELEARGYGEFVSLFE